MLQSGEPQLHHLQVFALLLSFEGAVITKSDSVSERTQAVAEYICIRKSKAVIDFIFQAKQLVLFKPEGIFWAEGSILFSVKNSSQTLKASTGAELDLQQ